jgi:hypothetical protein
VTAHPAPTAPGRLGEQLDPAQVQSYLADLEEWLRDRRADLDEIDAAALVSVRGESMTADLMLSMALWKAVSDRYQLLFATWDGGRVGPTERERLSALVWGRLDATLDPDLLSRGGAGAAETAAGLAVSLPEACRLLDALAHQLRVQLALDPAADEFARRIKELREGLERVRDQVLLEPPQTRARAEAAAADLAARLEDVAARAGRGADVGGLLGPLENDAARVERDLIVAGAQRRDARDRVAAAEELRADLAARAAALQSLAAQTVRTVYPAPRYAVPDVGALGAVPAGGEELAAYQDRLGRVSQALNLVHDRYSAALGERSGLLARVEAAAVRAGATGADADADVRTAAAAAQNVIDRQPTPLVVAGHLVAAYEAWIEFVGRPAARKETA